MVGFVVQIPKAERNDTKICKKKGYRDGIRVDISVETIDGSDQKLVETNPVIKDVEQPRVS